MAQDRPVIEFDHHDERHNTDVRAIYEELRDRCPVGFTEAHGGYWVIARYDDASQVAADYETFSSAKTLGANGRYVGGGLIPVEQRPPMIPLQTDPPQALDIRRILSPAFTPSAARAMRPSMEAFTSALIDSFIEKGECDIVLDLANPMPALVTLELVGIPLEHWHRYAEPQHRVVYATPGSDEHLDALEQIAWARDQVLGLVAERRAHPGDDLLSRLATAAVDGEPLTDADIVATVMTVIGGGVDTTTALFSNIVMYLDSNPAAREQLIANPDLIPSAIEEFLRHFTPSRILARTATRDAEVGGERICSGDRVAIAWYSANHDESQFEDPYSVVLDRSPNPHRSFGWGIHRCIGSHIAVAEVDVLLRALLDRMPDYSVDRDGATRYPNTGLIDGWVKIPIRFTPGRVLGESVLT